MSREKLDVDLQESRSKNSPKTSNNPFDIVRSLKIENYSDETDKMVQQQQQRESMTKKEYKSLQILNEEMRKLDRGTCLMTMLEPDSTLAIKQNAEVIQQHLQLLFSDQKLCDLIIRNDEKQYNIHSIILMMHSDKYKTIFMDAANSPPTEIPLVEISCKIIEKLIHYMYTFKIVIDDESIDEILNVSHQLDMKILIQKCVEHLRQYNMSNCLKYFMISKKYNLGELSSQYLDFAKSNFIHISKLPEFLMLDADDIRSLIDQSDDSSTKYQRVDFLIATLNWAKTDSTRNVHLARLLEKICLHKIDPEEIKRVIDINQFILQIPDCVEVLRKVFRFHAILNCTQGVCQPAVTRKSVLEPCLFVVGGVMDSRHPYKHGDTVLRCSLGTGPSKPKQWIEDCPLPAKRCGHCIVVINSSLYVLGGAIQEGDSLLPFPTRTVHRYNNILRKWENVASMIDVRNEFAACEIDGNIYALGGETDHFWYFPTDSVECYCPESNTWTMSESMPVARSSHAACGHKGLIYVVGGCLLDNVLSFVDVFNVSEKKWTSRRQFPVKICRGSLVNAMGCMFHIGGVSFQDEIILSSSDKIYEYEEQTDDWKPVGNLTLPRHLCATVASGSNIYVIGGFSTCTWTSSCKISNLDIITRSFVDSISDLPYSLMNTAAGISMQYTKL